MPHFSFEQRFIVTGASHGIGKDVALLLNEYGASVICIARNLNSLSIMKDEAKHPEYIFIEQKDLSDNVGYIPKYINELKDKYGSFKVWLFVRVPGK